MPQNNAGVKILVFDKVGQKELIKVGEKIQVVLGNSIQPEFCYFKYKTEKNINEFSIELKSNLSYLMEISRLKNANDSAIFYLKKLNELQKLLDDTRKNKTEEKSNRIDTVVSNKENKSGKSKIAPFEKEYSIFEYNLSKHKADSLRRELAKIDESLYRNNIILEKNSKRIDTIKSRIDTANDINELNKIRAELDSLVRINRSLMSENKGLAEQKFSIEQELMKEVTLMGYLIKIITFLAVIILLIAVSSFFIYRNYKQKKLFNISLKKVNLELNQANKDLASKNEELNKLIGIIRKDISKASDYLFSIIPPPIIEGPIRTDWEFIPSVGLGGDTIGFNWLDKNHFAFYLVDVSGHGTGPALHSVQILNTLQSMLLPIVDYTNPAEVMTALNHMFQMEDHNNVYFTMFYGVFNFKDKKLRYANAGHPPAIYLNENGCKLLESQNTFIGINPKIKYTYDEIDLIDHSQVYLYSDGVYEYQTADGSMYELYDFVKLVMANKDRKNLKYIYENALAISNSNSLEDDFTIIRIKFDSID